MIDDLSLGRIWKDVALTSSRHYSGVYWEGLRKNNGKPQSGLMAVVPSKIRTEHLQIKIHSITAILIRSF
jgi:hypothetical protein